LRTIPHSGFPFCRGPRRTAATNTRAGNALISGGYPMTGAARMAGCAAARAGAGLTTIAVSEIALPIYATALTSIMVRPLAAPEDFNHLLGDRRISAFLIGPGAGVGEETRARALAMLATGRPTLLDADAITSFQDDPSALGRAIVGPCVMTPHEGEFRRLFDPTGDKLTRACAAAHLSGAFIVLKGSDTVIAAPDGRAIINANAPPTLATAGSGRCPERNRARTPCARHGAIPCRSRRRVAARRCSRGVRAWSVSRGSAGSAAGRVSTPL